MVLVGMQPLLTQVPPRSLRSMSAVFSPSLSRRAHNAGPAWPAPITMASKRSVTVLSSQECSVALRPLVLTPAKDDQPVVRRHGVVLLQHEAMARGELADVLEIAQAARRVTAAQPPIELGVARRCVLAALVDRP